MTAFFYASIAVSGVTGAFMLGRLKPIMSNRSILHFGAATLLLASLAMLLLSLHQPPQIIQLWAPMMLFSFANGFLSPYILMRSVERHSSIMAPAISIYGCIQMGLSALITALLVSHIEQNPLNFGIIMLLLSITAVTIGYRIEHITKGSRDH